MTDQKQIDGDPEEWLPDSDGTSADRLRKTWQSIIEDRGVEGGESAVLPSSEDS